MKLLKRLSLTHQRQIITFLSMILLFIGALNVYYIAFENRVANDECWWRYCVINKGKLAVTFDSVKKDGVTWNAGIRNGDLFLAVDSIDVIDTQIIQHYINNLKEDQSVTYKVQRGDEIFYTELTPLKKMNFTYFSFSLLSFIWLLVGYIVLISHPEGRLQRIFYLIGATGVVYWMREILISSNLINALNYSYEIYRYSSLTYLFWFTVSCFAPALILHFFWLFPRKTSFIDKKWFLILNYTIPIALAIFGAIEYFRIIDQPSIFQSWRSILLYLLYASVAYIVGLISFFIGYLKIKDKQKRKPILIILIAFLLGALSIVYISQVLPRIGDAIFNAPIVYFPVICVVFLPMAFGYTIFKYQLLDVSIVIKNTIIYGTATILLATIYLLSVYGLGQSIGNIIGTEYQNFIAAMAFVLFALIFQSTKDKFQDLLTRKFYPEQFYYQKALVSFSDELANIVGQETILQSIRSTFVDKLKVERFAIYLKNADGFYELKTADGFEYSPVRTIKKPAEVEEFIIETKERLKSGVIDQSYFKNSFPDVFKVLERSGLFTIVPMALKSRFVGFFAIGLKHSGSRFDGKDLDLLYTVANQAAISIENARLYEAEAERIQMEHDLEIARNIQQKLLPSKVPGIKGLEIAGKMIPASRVGGDYYDIIPVDDKRIFILVGDVSGKGLSAALYMTKLQTMIQLYCGSRKSPKEILMEINSKLYKELEKSYFITVTLALFDTEHQTLRFCRAGHMPTLLSENGSVEIIKPKGLALGLDKGAIFDKSLTEHEMKLKKDQLYFFYSDGVNETMNAMSEEFGNSRLFSIIKGSSKLNPNELLPNLIKKLNEFQGDTEQHDDITAVAVKIL